MVRPRTFREGAIALVEPLTLALALGLGALGALGGWHARGAPATAVPETAVPLALQRVHPPAEATAYVDALCVGDVAYLQRNTGESWGRMPWEPRLSEWTVPCSRHRYLGALVDRLGRETYVFTLLRSGGTEVLYVITFGADGRVANVD